MDGQRAALGRTAAIGALYDARTDELLPKNGSHSSAAWQYNLTEIYRSAVEASFGDCYASRFKALKLQPDLAASVLAGLVKPAGCSTYLGDAPDPHPQLLAHIHHTFSTVQEKLILDPSGFQGFMTYNATHIISGITWGVQSKVTFRGTSVPNLTAEEAEDKLQSHVSAVAAVISGRTQSAPSSSHVHIPGLGLAPHVTIQSDVLNQPGLVAPTTEDAIKFIDLVPMEVRIRYQGRGIPLMYELLPVGIFAYLTGIVSNISPPEVVPPETLSKFVALYDQLHLFQGRLHNYETFLSIHNIYVGEQHRLEVSDAKTDLERARSDLSTQYGNMLNQVRSGHLKPSVLLQLHDAIIGKMARLHKLLTKAKINQERLAFIASSVHSGAVYIGPSGPDLQTVLQRQKNKDVYVMHFSATEMQANDDGTWLEHRDLLHKLLGGDQSSSLVILVDCDATGIGDRKTRISMYRNGQEITHDVLERDKFLADKCFALCPEETLERQDIKPPLSRRFVKIPCPGPGCDQGVACEWLCMRCESVIEFGFSDEYIYCDCGRSPYHTFAFRCNNCASRANEWVYHEPATLLGFLRSLNTPDNINILILGETGVGKSTFINAFVNYLTFEKLDEAIECEHFNWVIPSSFSVQQMDRSQPGGEIKEVKVTVGSARKDEADGSGGASATQETSVHSIAIGRRTLRLIDTPGIGDTRGVAFDKKNMADILNTLRSYDELHGILILLKSNSARLTVTFNFCMKELLTHLHRSAADNVVFGFTNTRISNYTPGDTFGPLKALLSQHSDVGLRLTTNTTYCFDSEAFRYLAALKSGVAPPNKLDFDRSWQHSREETLRLVQHFKSRPPHRVKNTVSLNRARQLILELTKPMADVSQMIRVNMARCEDQKTELENLRLSGEDLRRRLNLERTQFRAIPLNNPRTVCKNEACIEVHDDGTGTGTVVTNYKTHCHKRCSLQNVQIERVADPGLIHCYAMDDTSNCKFCKHHWMEHMHVLVELEEYTATVLDPQIEKQLASHADDTTLRTTAIHQINRDVAEYRAEHEKIRQTAVEFGLFLKEHSITAYNDATLAYLDMLIKDEETKIHAAKKSRLSALGNERRLANLQEDRRRHEELVKTLEATMSRRGGVRAVMDQADVDRRIQELFSLRHFGRQLQDVKNILVTAHNATYRERPYRVRMGGGVGSRAGWSTQAVRGVEPTFTKSRNTAPRQGAEGLISALRTLVFS